jgi:salicylate hydroxylase
MAIEDGAALGECLDRATSKRDIRKVLQAFQTIRKPRCERVQLGSRDNGQIWHLPDGEEQEQRDKGMRQIEAQQDEPNPNQWNDEDFQPWLFGHDLFSYVSVLSTSYLNIDNRGTDIEQTNDTLDVILKP